MPNQNYQFATDTADAEIKADITMGTALTNINRQISEEKTAKQAKAVGLPYIDVLAASINSDLISQIDLTESTDALAIPFFEVGKKWRVAVANPEKPETKAYIKNLQNDHYQVVISLASADGIRAKLAELVSQKPQQFSVVKNQDAESDLESYEEEIRKLKALAEEAYHLSAEESLNRIFISALRTRASDIHFQLAEKQFCVRFRIDGVLQKVLELEVKIGLQITDQLKYGSKLRLNVRNVPQDGRTSFLASGRKVDVRVSTLPTEYGEGVVCRILDSDRGIIPFDQLGFEERSLRPIEAALKLKSGLILVTGPTGSGKTTTLYTMLDQLNKPENKVVTLEDPVEYHLPNIVQSQVDDEVDYKFADGLRALLRQDPDVIMVGEIRDRETAETAAQAAMTGHVVLSTLHTNSAIEAVPRLVNIGLPPFMLASSLSLIIAQRLVRRVHADCAEQVKPTAVQRKILGDYLIEIKKVDPRIQVSLPDFVSVPKGCPACSHTGYRGQLAIIESCLMTDILRELILREASTAELVAHVRNEQKGLSLVEDGMLKVCKGLTTVEEIVRVAGVVGLN